MRLQRIQERVRARACVAQAQAEVREQVIFHVTFDHQPVLIGESIRLRPLLATDFAALRAAAADPLIWAQHPDPLRHTPDGFRRFFDAALASGGALIVEDRATAEILGTSRFHGYDPVAGEIEIGWTFLIRRCWGGEVNGELKRLMLGHALPHVASVIFLVAPDNTRSRRALEKIGAIPGGERTDGSGHRAILYRVTA